mgnify:CR=1 FL=1
MKNHTIPANIFITSLVILICIQACSPMTQSASNLSLESYGHSSGVTNLSDKPSIFNEM